MANVTLPISDAMKAQILLAVPFAHLHPSKNPIPSWLQSEVAEAMFDCNGVRNGKKLVFGCLLCHQPAQKSRQLLHIFGRERCRNLTAASWSTYSTSVNDHVENTSFDPNEY